MTRASRVQWSLVAVLACLLLSGAAGPPDSREGKPSPSFSGKALPEPPKQKQPWTPPKTKLQKELLTAAVALFKSGLGDPRGCEYRIIEVGTGSCWSGDAGIVRTHGWVLPARKGEKQRFAVAWNGLVYPAVSVGRKADLRGDIRAALAADAKQRARAGFYRFRHAWTEQSTLSPGSLLPLKACLLLRLGEEELARGVWEAWTAGMRAGTNDDATHLRDPYLMLATDIVWARFDRLLGAHMRGDDRLALLDARALSRLQKTITDEADNRGFPRNDKNDPHLDFLRQLPDLLADLERRALKKPEPKPPRGVKGGALIAALIRDLENASARQWGQPGGVSFNTDGIVYALIREGEASVEPLLKCLEEDKRLTRSVQFHRDFFNYRRVLAVHEAAHAALSEILQSSFPRDDRKKAAAAFRAHWKKFGTLPLEERWYLILADDKAEKQWLQMAANIVQPVEDGKKGERRLRGEPLRKKKPSVGKLLARRIEALSRLGEGSSDRHYRLNDACRMTDHLIAWDSTEALPVLRKQIKVCREYLAGKEARIYGAVPTLGAAIARFTLARLRGGDRTALDDYSDWIKTVRPDDVSHSCKDLLRPMWQYPGHPAVMAAAEKLFEDGSPWCKRFLRAYPTRDLIDTPMVGVAAFRKRLLAEFKDTRPAGKLKLNAESYGFLEVYEAYSGGSAIHSRGDPLAPKPGTTIESRIDGAPRCELYWPVADRDKAVGACVAFLKKYGERFEYSPPGKLLDPYYPDRARMSFPLPGRPATGEDVKKVRAIFSLDDAKGKVRLAKVPALPLRAKWLGHKGAPRIVQTWDTKRKRAVYAREYDQEGVVWQAEEVLKNGKWVRYYGFVGRHVVAKVPAGEVEFVAAGR